MKINRRINKVGRVYFIEFAHGYAFLHVDQNSATADIVDLRVDPAWRGQGLSHEYIAELLVIARKEGASRVVAHVRPDNTPSHRAFKHAGFETTSQEDHMELDFPGCAPRPGRIEMTAQRILEEDR